MRVEEIMTTDVVAIDRSATVRDAVELMLDRGVGSALVLDDGTPVGILTESDALGAGYESGQPFDDIDAPAAMSEPLETVDRDTPVKSALRRMTDAGIEKLVVTDDFDVVGIVTLTDVAVHMPEAVAEARSEERQRGEWEE